MSVDAVIDGVELFEQHYGTVMDLIQFVSRRNRLGGDEREDFTSYVTLKLVENDYRRLRKYRGDSTFKTYLAVVVQRLFLDYRTQKWGKWRPSSAAMRLGSLAVQLETLLYRDGFELREAQETLSTGTGSRISHEELWELALQLPRRERPLRVDEDVLLGFEGTAPRDELVRAEKSMFAHQLEGALKEVLGSMTAEDRLILRMRFSESASVPEIARTLALDAKSLYARIARLLKRVRKELELQGFGPAFLEQLWGCRELEIDFHRIFPEASSVESNREEVSV